ncbi:MAG: hypothetical protein E7295_06900 [Lachnospiraceae bacterium]|jgi:hypothetical protein|nr:hypothetical protein [Lachnospiraceae bacterium]
MKKKIIVLALALGLSLSACGTESEESKEDAISGVAISTESQQASDSAKEDTADTAEAQGGETAGSEAQTLSGDSFVGEYVDEDGSTLEIAPSVEDETKYVVQISIFRLTSLEDGVGTMTAEGLEFTATDANGEPIVGVVTLEGDKGIVTFTDSTWTYLENGTKLEFTKTSDIPFLQQE